MPVLVIRMHADLLLPYFHQVRFAHILQFLLDFSIVIIAVNVLDIKLQMNM